MKANIKKMWIEALTSGKYTQGINQLKGNNVFCCLGVLCDLYSKKTKTPWTNNTMMGCSIRLPDKVVKWAKLTDGDPVVFGKSLSEWNDGANADFSAIAALIKEGL